MSHRRGARNRAATKYNTQFEGNEMNDHESIWQRIAEWWHLLWHHAQAGTLPPAPVVGGDPVMIPPVGATTTPPAPPLPTTADTSSAPTAPAGLHAGFFSHPNEHGYVMLLDVEADRWRYSRSDDSDYRVWANDLPRWFAIDDTLKWFTLSPEQEKKLRTDLAQAQTLLALQGAGDWAINRAANLPDSGAFSDGGQDPENHGVHLRNLEQALAHQRAHYKAIGAGTNPTGAGAVAGPGGPRGPRGPRGPHGPGHGAMANGR